MVTRKEEILEAKDSYFAKAFSKNNLELNMCLLGIILKVSQDTELGIPLVEVQNNDQAVQITALLTIERILHFDLSMCSPSAHNILFQFLLNDIF